MFKVIYDNCGDETTVDDSGDEVRVEAMVDESSTVMYFSPKRARKLAKALKKAAKTAETRA